MSVDFAATLAQRRFDVAFTVEEGETVAILGPNGAGKSTLLALIAGLLWPDSGRAQIGDRVLFDLTTAGRARFTPPHARGISLLAQEPLLFPHLSVLGNVAFGPRSTGSPTPAAEERARQWLREVDALELAHRRPHQISGGQAQRVAVARALAPDPHLLLLDEPMAALDVSVAPAVRRMLGRVLTDRTAIIVTHDILDALTLADRVFVMNAGRIVESGPTSDVLERPRTAFTAELAGLNLLEGVAEEGGLVTYGGWEIPVSHTDAWVRGASVFVTFRPVEVTVWGSEPQSVPAGYTVIEGAVRGIEPRGDVIRVSGPILADLTAMELSRLDLEVGQQAWFGFSGAAATVYRA